MTTSNLIAEAANALINGDVHLVTGVRNVLSLLDETRRMDPRFSIFIVVDSEADSFPVTPEARAMWNKDALDESDARYAEAVDAYRPEVIAACHDLIAELG